MLSERYRHFKVESTSEELLPFSGLVNYAGYIASTGILDMCDKTLPLPGSGNGFLPSYFLLDFVLMLTGGGNALEDSRVLRDDMGLLRLLDIDKLPAPETLGKWLYRTGERCPGGLEQLNRNLCSFLMDEECREEYTLDIDATEIVADKKDAKYTYKGNPGYMPILGHLAENDLVVGMWYRNGNVAPADDNLEFIKYCRSQMPERKRITRLRADAASYQAAIFDYCTGSEIGFAVRAVMDSSVYSAIAALSDTDWLEYKGDIEVARTVHTMNESKHPFELVVVRRKLKPGDQLRLDNNADYRYFAIATNMEEMDSIDIIAFYNQRGDACENRIKELKLDFGMELMPCSDIRANAIFAWLCILAYNLFVVFRQTVLPAKWCRVRAKKMRWIFFNIAGRVVRHGRQLILKIPEYHFKRYIDIRNRIVRFAEC